MGIICMFGIFSLAYVLICLFCMLMMMCFGKLKPMSLLRFLRFFLTVPLVCLELIFEGKNKWKQWFKLGKIGKMKQLQMKNQIKG